MKKRLIFIFLTIIVLLGVIYLLRYERALVFENKVPSSVTQVININTRQIEHHILVDFLKNPFTYISFKSSKKDKDSLSLFDAVSIPRNTLLFTNDTDFRGVLLSAFLKVTNETELSDYLTREGFKKSKYEDLVLFNKSNLVFAVKNKRLIIAYKTAKEVGIIPLIKAVFNETDFLSESSELLKPIINSKSDISYATLNNDFLEANFKNGLFEVIGTIKSNLFVSENHEEFSQNSIAFLNARFNTNHNLIESFITNKNSVKFKEITKLSIDSITNGWNGNIAFDLKSIQTKADTIITYEYDDDFNKTEKINVQEITVPNLDFRIGTKADLADYFFDRKAIQIIESDTLFTGIPLYKLYVNSTPTTLNISTQKSISDLSEKNKDSYKLNAFFNIEKYVQNPLDFSLLPTNKEYIQLFKSTSIELSDNNELSAKVKLKNTKRNFIGQLAKH